MGKSENERGEKRKRRKKRCEEAKLNFDWINRGPQPYKSIKLTLPPKSKLNYESIVKMHPDDPRNPLCYSFKEAMGTHQCTTKKIPQVRHRSVEE